MDECYTRLVGDVQLATFFEGVDIELLKKHQYIILSMAFRNSSFGVDLDLLAFMIEKHERLFAMGLTPKHFDMVAEHLVSSMEHLDPTLIEEVINVIGPL